MTHIDDELRERFGELRADVERELPAFPAAELRAASAAERFIHKRSWSRRRLAAAAIVCVAVGTAFAVRHFSREEGTGSPIVSIEIVQWRSPTATLLRPTLPLRDVLAPPPLLSSVLDGATSGIIQRKGD